MKNGKIFLILLLICTLLTFTACATDDDIVPDVPNITNGGITDGNGNEILNDGDKNTNNGGVDDGLNNPRDTTNGGISD